MSRGVQPFQVGITTIEDATEDKKLLETETQLPNTMRLYVDKDFFYETGVTIIVDFTLLGDYDFLFIPLIPKPLESYSIWSVEDDA